MTFFLNGTMILLGFVSGYFFQTQVLVALSIICLVAGVYMISTLKEMASLIAMIFIACAAIANVTMWITHYLVTDQSWLQVFFKTHILR